MAEFLAQEGQLLLPMVDLIEQATATLRAAWKLDEKQGKQKIQQ